MSETLTKEAERTKAFNLLLEAAIAQEELSSLRMPGDTAQNIIKVRELRRRAIAEATASTTISTENGSGDRHA